MASRLACRILMRSISSTLASATDQASALARISIASASRRFAESFFESFSPSIGFGDRGSPPQQPPARPAARDRPHRHRIPSPSGKQGAASLLHRSAGKAIKDRLRRLLGRILLELQVNSPKHLADEAQVSLSPRKFSRACARFSGVASSWMNSGTTNFPARIFGNPTYGR
jgi:hypothetical protein